MDSNSSDTNRMEMRHNASDSVTIMNTEIDVFTTRSYFFVPKYDNLFLLIICLVISLLIFTTIICNTFVITAVLFEKRLQAVSNYLILSLAITDLMVAVCVMPLSLLNEISVYWYLGNVVCDFWTSTDILCCTASILHLVAISMDRFWGVSNIEYIKRRSKGNILKMICIVWVVSFAISIPPLLGWKEEINNPEVYGSCFISQNHVYTIISTVVAFYCPLILMVILNYKIYIAARYRIRKRNFDCGNRSSFHNCSLESDIRMLEMSSFCSEAEDSSKLDHHSGCENGIATPAVAFNNFKCCVKEIKTRVRDKTIHETSFGKHVENNNKHKSTALVMKKQREYSRRCKDILEMKRERRAVKVLGIITGAFIACWLPFFILALIIPFCPSNVCGIHPIVKSLSLWLGYFNSLLNPILYTRFNPAFRKVFKMKSKR